MGSLGPEPDDSSKEWNVLVTGFGPFLDNHTNPSYLIASHLPSHIHPLNLPKINIHTYPAPIPVSYKTVRALIPPLLFPASSPTTYDIMLHLGLAAGRKHYSLETLAHRDAYTKEDIHNITLAGSTYWRDLYHAPETLAPCFDVADVYRRWIAGVGGVDVRMSNDAGRYLCEFIFYASMVEFWRRGRGAPCMFLHVPGGSGGEDVERGVEVAVGLIGGAVGSECGKRKESV